jgi:chromosomal replication initiation ATPase DnaA
MAGIPVDELDEDTRLRIGFKPKPSLKEVGDRLIVLGKVFRVLKGLTDEDALAVLQQAQISILKQSVDQVISQPGEDGQNDDDYVPPIGWTIQVVSMVFNLEIDDLKRRKRSAEISLARQAAMYTLYMMKKYTLTEIGQALGGRSPATVSHGFHRIAGKLNGDSNLRDKISEIHSRLLLE